MGTLTICGDGRARVGCVVGAGMGETVGSGVVEVNGFDVLGVLGDRLVLGAGFEFGLEGFLDAAAAAGFAVTGELVAFPVGPPFDG